MSVHGIVIFTLRAAGFAAIVCGIHALICRICGRTLSVGRLLSVFYIASLIEITVLRGGISWNGLFDAERLAVQWMPFKTTLDEFKSGAWPFICHVGGNLAWFIPLGLIVRRKSAWTALLAGILISVAIECLQWAFITGITDVDDMIFDQTKIPSYYVEDHHTPLVDHKTFEMVQRIRQLRAKSAGTSPQYPYAQWLVCPACGEKLIQCTIDAQGSRSAWFCGGENGCGQFAVRTEYLNHAVISAYEQLNIDEIHSLAFSQDSVISENARTAQRLKEELPSPKAVEYYWLDELVEAIRFIDESAIEISWKCALTTVITVEYRFRRERPYHIAGLL